MKETLDSFAANKFVAGKSATSQLIDIAFDERAHKELVISTIAKAVEEEVEAEEERLESQIGEFGNVPKYNEECVQNWKNDQQLALSLCAYQDADLVADATSAIRETSVG